MNKILLLVLFLLVACNREKDEVTDFAKKEARGTIEMQNENYANRVSGMENDLLRKNRFYKGISGEFTGGFTTANSTFLIKVTMFPTINILYQDRIRTLEEIQDDLNNLGVNAQVRLIDAKTGEGVSGHIYQNIKANFKEGFVQLYSATEKLRYVIFLSNQYTDAKQISLQLMENSLDKAEVIFIEGFSNYGANYRAVLNRKKE